MAFRRCAGVLWTVLTFAATASWIHPLTTILETFLPETHVASQLAPELVQGDLLQVGAFKKVCDGLARRVLVDLWSGSGHGHRLVDESAEGQLESKPYGVECLCRFCVCEYVLLRA